jgi:hypothetical protein
MSIATDDCNQGNAPWLKTCSMTYRTHRTAVPEYRRRNSTSGSTLAAANDSEDI